MLVLGLFEFLFWVNVFVCYVGCCCLVGLLTVVSFGWLYNRVVFVN